MNILTVDDCNVKQPGAVFGVEMRRNINLDGRISLSSDPAIVNITDNDSKK